MKIFKPLTARVIARWHPTKNKTLNINTVSAGSNKKVWWLCPEGHDWEALVTSLTAGQDCPYCSGNRVWEGFNDLATTVPTLAAQWHPTKNSITPQEISSGSNKKVWWLCPSGHEWQAQVNNRKNGSGCFQCSYTEGKRQLTVSTPKPNVDDFATLFQSIAAEWHPTKNGTYRPNMFKKGSDHRSWWECSVGHEWEAKIADRTHYQTGCPFCSLSIYVSKGEQQIVDFILSLKLKVEQSNRSILDGSEIDIWVAEKRIGIEFNGVYWHNDSRKTTKYHYNKWLIAKNKGIQLIQIWEDDWNRNSQLIKDMLAYKLGVSSLPKIFARKTSVVEMNKTEVQKFMEANHVQGFASGSYYLGLQDTENNNIVAVIILKNEAKTDGKSLNIIRYATSSNVVGGFTKLLTYAEKTLLPDRFVTFSDHTISDGGLYSNNGFTADKELPPDYMYVINSVRKHKFGYRVKRFKNDENLLWEEGLTESELAKLNNLNRIWDAGKTRWVREVSANSEVNL